MSCMIQIAITVPIKFSILGKSKLISPHTFKAMVLTGTTACWGKPPGPPGTHL